MKTSLKRCVVRASVLALMAGGTCVSANAQFLELLQSVLGTVQQNPAQQAAEQQVQQAQQEATPSKNWPTTVVAVPDDLTRSAQQFVKLNGDGELSPLLSRLYVEGERNAVLNLERIGLSALYRQQLDLAGRAFDGAISRIERIYADNAAAQQAKSLWSEEKVKDFKGEPYERAMAYFYRGLVYAAEKDFQNARAMFKQAEYQDTVAEAEQYGGDFGLMSYMAGWASYCDGNIGLAKDFLDQAAKGDAVYRSVPVVAPVLVLYETGRIPLKYGAGKHAELLKWHPREQASPAVTDVCADKEACIRTGIVKGADLNYQATTRGGRPIDGVLAGKASFKDGTETAAGLAGMVGQVGLQVASQTGSQNAANWGVFGTLANMVGNTVAKAMTPAADIREWEQLPQDIWLTPITTKMASDKLAVKLAGSAESIGLAKLVDGGGCKLFWGRQDNPLSLLGDAGPIEPGQGVHDRAFRDEIGQLMPQTQAALNSR